MFLHALPVLPGTQSPQKIIQKLFVSFTSFEIVIFLMLPDILVCRTNDLAFIYQLFDSVSTPACNSGNRKDRSEHLLRNIQHGVNKSTVEVDIAADWFMQILAVGQKI